MVDGENSSHVYVLGHSAQELERLRVQARLIDPITRHFLTEAGIGPGMRVLDVGSGAGDVAFLAADMVGPTGAVFGFDRSPTAIDKARERARQRSLSHVTFAVGDVSTLDPPAPFDAAIGRYVLCFQPDPAAMVRAVARFVRPGGLVLFHEPDRSLMRSVPPVPTYDRACEWVTQTYLRSGVDVRIGVKLHATYLAAGLPSPAMRLHAVIGGAEALDEIHLDADQAAVLADDIERLGLATKSELGAETLVDRISRELAAQNAIIMGRAEIGAWSRIPKEGRSD